MSINGSQRDALARFVEQHPVDRVSRNLRRLLILALGAELLIEELDFKDIMYDLEGLFTLLDGLGRCDPMR